MALTSNQKAWLLVGGATALFLYSRANQTEQKPIISGGGGSGGIFAIPSGFGTNEATSPLMSLPEVKIYEAPLPSYSPPSDSPTKKEMTFVQSGADKIYDPQGKGLAGGYYDSSGKIVAVADPLAQQSRLPTATEKFTNLPSYTSGEGNSTQIKKESSGAITGTFQGLPVSIPARPTTKKESSQSSQSGFLNKIGNTIGKIGRGLIFI